MSGVERGGGERGEGERGEGEVSGACSGVLESTRGGGGGSAGGGDVIQGGVDISRQGWFRFRV